MWRDTRCGASCPYHSHGAQSGPWTGTKTKDQGKKGDKSTSHAGLTSALCYGEYSEPPVLNEKLGCLPATSLNVTLVARLVDVGDGRSRVKSDGLVGGWMLTITTITSMHIS